MTAVEPTHVDVPDLLQRLGTAEDFLAEMRDGEVATERARLASKIEGIQRCARALENATKHGQTLTVADVTELVARLDPATRPVTESLSEREHGISKGCELVLNYAGGRA